MVKVCDDSFDSDANEKYGNNGTDQSFGPDDQVLIG